MSANFNDFTRYLEKTALQDAVHRAFENLLSSNELPYNPYPQLVQHFRGNIERFTPVNQDKISGILVNTVTPTSVPYLYTIEGYQKVWGIPNILVAIDKSNLLNFRWLLDSILPSPNSLCIHDDYSNQVMLSLGGPGIFQSTFYPEPDSLQVFQQHLIIGPEKKKAIAIFVETILQDVEMIRNTLHFLIELWIGEENSGDQSSCWNCHQIDKHNVILVQSLTTAVENHVDIKVKCIFRLCAEVSKYCAGEKIFRMSFMETSSSTKNLETLEMFSRYPTRPLCQSVFLYRNHAEAFFSLNRENLADLDESQHFTAPESQVSSTPESHSSGHLKPFPLPKNKHSSHRAKLQTKFLDQSSFQNLIVIWQKRIATNEELQFFDSVYHTILLCILNRDSYPSDLLRELYQLLRCTLGKLDSLMKKTKILQDLSEKLLIIGDTGALVKQLRDLKQYAQNFLLYSKEERSCNIICLGQIFNTKVTEIIEATINAPEQVSFLLKELTQYLQAPFLEMLDDTLYHCPNFQMLVSHLKDFFQDTKTNKKKKKKNPDKILHPYKILHEIDDINLKFQDELVVNIKECLPDKPNENSKSRVLIQYLLDVHLDEVWEDYLIYVLMVKPVNPYGRLITKFRQSAMKMNLLSYSNEKLYQMLPTPNEIYEVDSKNYVFCLPGASVYGPVTALSLVDVSILRSILPRIPDFWDQPTPQQTGPYKVTICFGIGGWTLLYGSVQPYINEIRTYQHFYVEGPNACEKVGVEMFAYNTLQDMKRMIDANKMPVLGVQLSEVCPRYYTMEDLQLRVQSLCLEIEQTAFEKQSVCLQYLTKWNGRYFTVLKFYQLHYITRGKIGSEHFCQSDQLAFYQTIFPTAEKAAFHYQNNGPFHRGDPCSISNFNMASNLIKSTISVAKSRSCWLDVHRLLLLKYLIAQFSPNPAAHESKGEKMKRVNCTCACWRMLHSATAQLEYVSHRLQVLHCLMAILADQCPDVKLNDWMKLFHQKQKATSDNNLRMASFCVNTILQTTESLYQKLKSVLTSDMVMIGKTLTSVVLSKVNSVLEQDPKTSFYFPKQDEKALECVKEIMLMLQAIQDALSEDAHNKLSRNDSAVLTKLQRNRLQTPAPLSTVNEMDQRQEELSEVWNSHVLKGANNHSTDCYFCAIDVTGINKKNQSFPK